MTRPLRIVEPIADVEPDDAWTEIRGSWLRNVAARDVAPLTVKTYGTSLDVFADWARERGISDPVDVTRTDLEAFQGWALNRTTRRGRKASASTVAKHHRNLRVFFGWLADFEEVPNPFDKVAAPRVKKQPVDVFTVEELRALVGACKGREFVDRRDLAVLRLLLDTGIRRAELSTLRVVDVDRDAQLVTVIGKGGKMRHVPYGAKTAEALDLYLRVRSRHRDARDPALWLNAPDRARGAIGNEGIRDMLIRRARIAGVENVHPHRFRHTAADMFLSQDNVTEGDAMRRFGWETRVMVDHYGASAADRRAIAAFRKSSPADHV